MEGWNPSNYASRSLSATFDARRNRMGSHRNVLTRESLPQIFDYVQQAGQQQQQQQQQADAQQQQADVARAHRAALRNNPQQDVQMQQKRAAIREHRAANRPRGPTGKFTAAPKDEVPEAAVPIQETDHEQEDHTSDSAPRP